MVPGGGIRVARCNLPASPEMKDVSEECLWGGWPDIKDSLGMAFGDGKMLALHPSFSLEVLLKTSKHAQ